MTLPRFYPILDTQIAAERGCDAFEAADALTAAGARILQFRHKGVLSRDVFDLAERTASLCARRGVAFVMNDRADVAMLLASGLHVGQDDLPPAEARSLLGASRTLGFSTHNETQLRAAAAEPVDYVAFGPVFITASKANPDPVIGISEIARLRPLSARPLVAIGGITRENAPGVLAAGANAVAIIGDLYPSPASPASIARRTAEWLTLVDEN
jgi:thiamine-phosphate pyrophosphorylase